MSQRSGFLRLQAEEDVKYNSQSKVITWTDRGPSVDHTPFVRRPRITRMLAVVVSHADEASEHVGERLLEIADWDEHEDERRSEANGGGRYYRTDGVELRTFEDLHLHLDGVGSVVPAPTVRLRAALVFVFVPVGDLEEAFADVFGGLVRVRNDDCEHTGRP